MVNQALLGGDFSYPLEVRLKTTVWLGKPRIERNAANVATNRLQADESFPSQRLSWRTGRRINKQGRGRR